MWNADNVNVKLLGWVLGGAVALAVGGYLLHDLQVWRTSSALLRQATAAEADKQIEQAVQFYRAYLAEQPDDREALVRYGQALLKWGTAEARVESLRVFERALRGRQDRPEVRRQLAQTAVQLGRYSQAREHLDILIRDKPEDGELEEMLGFCFESERDYPEAVKHFEKAISQRPDLQDSHVHRAYLLRYQLDQPAEADEAMDRLVEANKNSWRAYLARGLYRKEIGTLDTATEDLARAEKLTKGTADILLPAAELAQVRGDVATAQRTLQQLLELEPHNAYLYKSLSGVALGCGRRDEAVEWLRRGLKAIPDNTELMFLLLDLLLPGREVNEAAELVAVLAKMGTPPGWIACLRAELLLQKGQPLEACRDLERLRGQPGTAGELATRIHLALARGYGQLGDTEAQVSAYRQAADTEPPSPAASRGLAVTLAATGRLDEAINEGHRVVARWPALTDGWVLLGRLLLQRQLQLPADKRAWKEVDKALERAARTAPASVQMSLLRAEVWLAQDQAESARRLLEQEQARQPDQVELWLALAALAERQARLLDAARLLAEAQQRVGDRVVLRLAVARHWLRRGGPAAAGELKRLPQGVEKFSAEEQSNLLSGLAEAYLRAGNRDEAVRLWTQLARSKPGDLRSRLVLFDLAVQAGQEEKLGPLIQEIRTLEGEEGAMWRSAEVVRLEARAKRGDQGAIAEARVRLAEASARRPSWSRLPLLAAHLDELEKRPAQALENYLQAIELGDRQPSVLARATQLLAEHNPSGRVPEILLPEQK